MQRIREQQESVGNARVFRRDHARLPSAVRLSGEIQRDSGSLLPKQLHGLQDAVAIALALPAGRASWARLTERQVPAQNQASGIAKGFGDRHHQGILTIASSPVRQKHRGADLLRLMQPAPHKGMDSGLVQSLKPCLMCRHVCYV